MNHNTTTPGFDQYITQDPPIYNDANDIIEAWQGTVGLLVQRLDDISRLPLNAANDFWCYTIIGKANAAVGELDDIIPGAGQTRWELEYKDAFRCATIILYHAQSMADDMPSSEHINTTEARELANEIVDYMLEVMPHLSKRRSV
jgi:hypothetical protein